MLLLELKGFRDMAGCVTVESYICNENMYCVTQVREHLFVPGKVYASTAMSERGQKQIKSRVLLVESTPVRLVDFKHTKRDSAHNTPKY
ncbi:hypothetical protein EXN66_Car017853 [Channa argus]|uniref:Uncharacterized protein n=1 Tax=Channa argus TaxID=215402 RepID=A0A6G1QHY4_CHAAH|nr:hypothetical protein EXN66_Car017853 [Channa argus]